MLKPKNLKQNKTIIKKNIANLFKIIPHRYEKNRKPDAELIMQAVQAEDEQSFDKDFSKLKNVHLLHGKLS